ncbi:MAG: hypothetical protein IKL82_00555 [Clostridia bacterium]|nr:hypothetical protein [Clostridia bacterium]
MNALLIRPGEKIEETNIDFTPDFFKDYFGEVVTGSIHIGYLKMQIHFIAEPSVEPPNFTLFGMHFYGNVLITGGKPNGEPTSLAYEDSTFIKRFINSYSNPRARQKIKEQSTW